MIKSLAAISLGRNRWILIAAVVVLIAAGTGWIVASGGWVLVLVMLALSGLLALGFAGPEGILVIVVCAGPFMVGRVVDLGPGTPDISLERVLLPWAGAVLAIQWLTRRRKPPVLELEDVLLGAFIVWGLLSIFWWKPGNLAQQLLDFGSYIFPLIAYMIVKSTADRKDVIRKFVMPAVPLLLVISIVVPGEWISGVNILGSQSEVVAGAVRSQSFLRSSWEFGTVAGMMMGLSTYFLGPYAAKHLRVLTGLAIGLGAVAILLSFMRAAWLGMLVVVCILAWQNRQLRGSVVLVIIILVLLGIAYFPILSQSELWTDRIAQTGNIVGRVLLLKQQWGLFLQKPLFGLGLGGIGSTTYQFSREYNAISHNMYMSHLISFGLLGLTYLVVIVLILTKSVDTYRRMPRGKWLGRELVAAIWAAVAVFLITAATLETRLFMYLNVLLWIALGLLAALRQWVRTDRGE